MHCRFLPSTGSSSAGLAGAHEEGSRRRAVHAIIPPQAPLLCLPRSDTRREGWWVSERGCTPFPPLSSTDDGACRTLPGLAFFCHAPSTRLLWLPPPTIVPSCIIHHHDSEKLEVRGSLRRSGGQTTFHGIGCPEGEDEHGVFPHHDVASLLQQEGSRSQ